MTREEAIVILDCERPYGNCGCGASDEEIEEALNMAIKALEQEPKEITLEDVKEYCKPRLLSIITNELYYELTHFKIKALEQDTVPFDFELYQAGLMDMPKGMVKILDKIRAEIIDKYMTATGEVNTVAKGCLQIIDKYKAESEVMGNANCNN